MNTIGKLLKKARENSNMTQSDVADIVGISRAYYADLERGRYNPSIKVLVKLCNLYNIDLNFLRENDGNTSNFN